jgi:hypothetical protein
MRYARFNEFSRRRRYCDGEAMTLPEEGTFPQFLGGGTLFLLGVLAKMNGRTWCFSGEVVVVCW